MSNPVALVTGAGGPAGRAVAEYFQQRGIEVFHADMQPLNAGNNFKLLPPADEQEFIPALDHVLDEARIKLLVPTVTEELPRVAEHRDSIRKKGCALFVSGADTVRIANDKWATACALSAHGIAVPHSYCGNSMPDLLNTVPFPMLSKPRFGRGGRGIIIHVTRDNLPQTISMARIYQEFLPGEEYDVNLFAEPGGRTRTSVVLRKTALKGGVFGNAVAVERANDPEIAELAERAVAALLLEGPIDMDIRRGEDGRPSILEINARVGANVRSAEEVLIALIASWGGMR
jgi:carbamoylphosphate synthase large subunit